MSLCGAVLRSQEFTYSIGGAHLHTSVVYPVDEVDTCWDHGVLGPHKHRSGPGANRSTGVVEVASNMTEGLFS